MKNTRTIQQLREKIYEAVECVTAEEMGVAFSGGVDSSLLAKVCSDLGKNVTLLTIGVSSRRDIGISSEVSEALGLKLIHELIPLEELEDGLKTVLSLIEFDRIVRLENCVSFYYVFRLASNHRLGTVLSANGMDELFCGYHVYRRHSGDERAMTELMKTLVETAKKDKEQIGKISALFDIEYSCPFLSKTFIDFTMKIPLALKIKSGDDELRKHILREVALEAGVPESAALRAKKAFQYSSGIHKAIMNLARKKGFSRQKARAAGFRSGMEDYIEHLRQSTNPIGKIA